MTAEERPRRLPPGSARRWPASLLALGLLLSGCPEEAPLGPQPATPLFPPGDRPAPVPAKSPTAAPRPPAAPADPSGGDGRLHVYFFDVGQGDAALVLSPSGRSVLIDAGPEEAGAHLAQRLPGILKGPIDLVVLTHARADHLGGMLQALRPIGARRFLDPGLGCTEPSCPALFAALKAAGTQVVLPVPDPAAPGEPVRIGLGGNAELTIFWPRAPVESLLAGGDPETNSLVMRIEFGETAILFAGEAQAETEEYLLRKRLDFHSTLLKVAAHGVDRATTLAFLEAVKPQAAIISAGPGNALQAPAKQTLARLDRVGARVFRTDLDGEIDAVSDGAHFLVTTQRPAAGEEPGTMHSFPPGPPVASPGARFPAPVEKAAPVAERPRPQSTAFAHVIDLDGKPADDQGERRVAEPRPTAPVPVVAKVAPPSSGASRYLASKNGKVFHMPDCRAAKRITKHNVIVYRSRAEAAKAKRPAADCNP
ncbi:MAG: ComEC/Rec2 family competence protein [Myxococcaceae bacterium]